MTSSPIDFTSNRIEKMVAVLEAAINSGALDEVHAQFASFAHKRFALALDYNKQKRYDEYLKLKQEFEGHEEATTTTSEGVTA